MCVKMEEGGGGSTPVLVLTGAKNGTSQPRPNSRLQKTHMVLSGQHVFINLLHKHN